MKVGRNGIYMVLIASAHPQRNRLCSENAIAKAEGNRAVGSQHAGNLGHDASRLGQVIDAHCAAHKVERGVVKREVGVFVEVANDVRAEGGVLSQLLRVHAERGDGFARRPVRGHVGFDGGAQVEDVGLAWQQGGLVECAQRMDGGRVYVSCYPRGGVEQVIGSFVESGKVCGRVRPLVGVVGVMQDLLGNALW